MKKRVLGSWLCALVGLSSTALATKELQVGSGRQYPTIQAAVDAVPATLDDSYVINVAPGVYREQVRITGHVTSAVNTITLLGDPEKTVIDAEGQRDYGIWLHRQKYVVIDGFTVRNAKKYGNIFLEQATGCAVRRCILTHARVFDGICLSGSTVNTIEHCVFFLNNRAGVYFNNSSNNCTVRFNIFMWNSIGMSMSKTFPSLPVINDRNVIFANRTAMENLEPGEHTLTADPQFVDAKGGNFRLKPSSPCLRWGVFGVAVEAAPSPDGNGNGKGDSTFFSIDLKPYANTCLKGLKPGDGGWTNQGDWDLRHLPSGLQTFCGIPFRLPANPADKAVIILKGTNTPKYPAVVPAIGIDRAVESLYFLHASAWTSYNDSRVMTYKVRYVDGREVDIPIQKHAQIGDWFMPEPTGSAAVAWKAAHPIHGNVIMGLYLYRWRNPLPFDPIKTVEIVSSGNTTPIVIGISGKKTTGELTGRINLLVRTSDNRKNTGFSLDYSSRQAVRAEATLRLFDEQEQPVATLGPVAMNIAANAGARSEFAWTPPQRPFSCNYRVRAEVVSDGRVLAATETFLPTTGTVLRALAGRPSGRAHLNPTQPLGGDNLIYSCEIQPWKAIHHNKFDRGVKPPAIAPEIFDNLKKAGGTVAHLVLWWSYLEPEPFKYDFRSLEYGLEQCRRVGLKASISVWMGDHGVPRFCRQENMIDQDGKPIFGDRGTNVGTGYHPSIWGPESRRHFGELIKTICRKYLDDDQVVSWGFLYQHVEVVIHDRVGKKPHLYDYSSWAQENYRRYLREVRGFSLETLNRRYHTAYEKWAEVVQPEPTATLDVTPRWNDFQDFRVYSARESFRFTFEKVREIDPGRRKILFTFNPRFSLDLCVKYGVVADFTGSESCLTLANLLAMKPYYHGPCIVEPTAIPPDVYEINAGFFNALTIPAQGYLWVGTVERGFSQNTPAAELFRRLRNAWTELSETRHDDADFALLLSNDTVHAEEKIFSHSRRETSGSNYDHLVRRLILNQYNFQPVTDDIFRLDGSKFKTAYKLILDIDSKVMRREQIAALVAQVNDGATLVVQPESGRWCRENPEPGEALAARFGWNYATQANWWPVVPGKQSFALPADSLLAGCKIQMEERFPVEKLDGEVIRAANGIAVAVRKKIGKGQVIMLAGNIVWEPADSAGIIAALTAAAGVVRPVVAAPMVRAALMTGGDVVYVLAFNENAGSYLPFKLTVPGLKPGRSQVCCVTDDNAALGEFDNALWRQGFPLIMAPHELRIYRLTPSR